VPTWKSHGTERHPDRRRSVAVVPADRERGETVGKFNVSAITE
jgi:hypothetical protein